LKNVVIDPGRFHPFHQGHSSVYDTLVSNFPSADVFVATSDKVDPPKSPFTFEEKAQMMQAAGVPASAIKKTKMPYRPLEIQEKYDPTDTIIMFAVSEKDMATDPRFAFKPLKDGSPSYFQPAGANMESMDKHGYIITVPTLKFKVLDKPMTSASEFRANFAKADYETQKKMITDLYGKYDSKVHNIMSNKITESNAQRLKNILSTVDQIKENLSQDQLSNVTTKVGKLMIEMQLAKKRNMVEGYTILPPMDREKYQERPGLEGPIPTKSGKVLYYDNKMGKYYDPDTDQYIEYDEWKQYDESIVEGLHQIDRENIMQSKVEVRGIGVYSIEGLMQNIHKKLDNLSNEAKSMEPFNYKNIKAKMDTGLLPLMLDSLTNAFNDIERTRRKGGAISKGIPANMFDAVEPITLDEYQVTQGVALRVLNNVAQRTDGKPFPVRMYDKNVIEVNPKTAKRIINLYNRSSEKNQKKIDQLLKTYNGYAELIKIASA
jgi:hypothetical protein